MADDIGDDNDPVLAELRALVSRHDPVPEPVVHAAREAWTWRTIDAELAALVYDSAVDDSALAGVRSTEAERLLTFEGEDITVEAAVTVVGDRRRIVAQLVPPQAATVEVRHGGDSSEVAADEVGRFSVDDVASGPVGFRVTLSDGRIVETAWVVM